MRSAITRRLVTAGLPIAALSAASTQVIAASRKPDAELLRLGEALSAAWARQVAAEAPLKVAHPPESSDACWERFDAAFHETHAIVDRIEALRATTLAGLIVKARACHCCHDGEPVEADFFAPNGDPSTDERLGAGILADILAMGVANA